MKTSMGLKEASQLAVDIFQALGWWCATAEKDILFIPKDSTTSLNGGNYYDFRG